MVEMPANVARVADGLSSIPGAAAVVLGGSRAVGAARSDSDWDLGVYYRSSGDSFDPEHVRGLGYQGAVSELGEWGPLVNGGGWFTVEGTQVDVLFRNLDDIEQWTRQAERGAFDVLLQAGSIVGAPTYLPVGELASCHVLHGHLEQPAGYPPALAASAPPVWRGQVGVNLLFARGYAGLADVANCLGMLSRAILCEAHARVAEQGLWALNEKRLIADAGLQRVQAALSAPGASAGSLTATVDAIEELLGVRAAVKG
ncbi:nucleotidyltransferase domain-containing protein [Nocardiopsis coralliicola]